MRSPSTPHGQSSRPGLRPTEPLALRPKEAAKALGIGPRLLWTMTNRGEIPHVRLGRAVLYPVDALRRWLVEQVAKGTRK